MGIYSLLVFMFSVGGIGVFKASRKVSSEAGKQQWIKYATYLVLVFVQAFLIEFKWYSWLAILVTGFGFFELVKVGKSAKETEIVCMLFGIFAVSYWCFFRFESVEIQQFLFVIVIAFDGFSQVFGQLCGRTKLFPSISPNKTYEGLIGGIFSVMIVAFLLHRALCVETVEAFVYTGYIVLFSVAGDFLASYFKRKNDVKDFSRIIPAHGGVLDRFDSLVVAAFGLFSMRFLWESNVEVWNCAVYGLLFLALFLLAEVGFRVLRCKVEATRKFVHVSAGLACLTFPFFLSELLSVGILCSGFVVVLIATKRFGWLPSVNAIDRKSIGSLLFPTVIFLCFVVFTRSGSYLYFYLPVVILAICDPLAALFGKRWPYGRYRVGHDHKTIVGSCAFLFGCFAITAASLYFFETGFSVRTLLLCFALAICTTFAEAVSANGYDNLTIPICVTLGLAVYNL